MQVSIKNKIGARFKLVAHKGDGKPTKETGWFHNLVLNTGLDRMSVNTWINRCCVGSGNSQPKVAQISLDNFIASTTNRMQTFGVANTTNTPYYYGVRLTWRFGEGVAAGNLSEVGLGWGDTELWNRALIKDTSGNATTITILSDEYLDVVSEIRVYPQPAITGSFNLLNKTGSLVSTHTYFGMPLIRDLGVFNAEKVTFGVGSWLYGYTGEIGSSVTQGSTGDWIIDNTPDLKYPSLRSVRGVSTLGLSSGNGTVKSFDIRNISIMGEASHGYKIQIDPPITKNNTQIMTYTFELAWGRYEPT